MAEAFQPNSFQINGSGSSLTLKFIEFAYRQTSSAYVITLDSPIISYCPIWIAENHSALNSPTDIFIMGLNSYDKSQAKKEYPISSNWRGRYFELPSAESFLITLTNGSLQLKYTLGTTSNFSYFGLIAVFTE